MTVRAKFVISAGLKYNFTNAVNPDILLHADVRLCNILTVICETFRGFCLAEGSSSH